MTTLEIVAETRYTKWIRSCGGICVKLTTAGGYGETGYNDRLVLLPGHVILVIEFKRKGEKAKPLQRYRHRHIKLMGFACYVCKTFAKAKLVTIKEIQTQSVPKRVNRVRADTRLGRILSTTWARQDNDLATHFQNLKRLGYR